MMENKNTENKNTFFPLAFRMKYISRWGLMRATEPENLLEHSAHCAILAHALACIGNEVFGENYDAGDIAVKALYHDTSEIYTGDLPTPIKYHNDDISASYKSIEHEALEKLLIKLPDELKEAYEGTLQYDGKTGQKEKNLIKAADKLCAVIKCMQECRDGNKEFSQALQTTLKSLGQRAENCRELKYFMEKFLPEFEKSLDEL